MPCGMLLDPLEIPDRCTTCFNLKAPDRPCLLCHRIKIPYRAIGAVFDYDGPASSLIKQLKYGNLDYLASPMGAYMTTQFIELNWPLPDLIVPVPIAAPHLISRGFNQSQLLAQTISTLLQRPLMLCLGRYAGNYSQAGLNREQRMETKKNTITLLTKEQVKNQTILLIDDVMTTGNTLRNCAKVLQQGSPKEVFVLTFCKAKT